MHPLLSTWRLKSYVVTAATGETSTPYGEHPVGYLSYSADGRMQAIGTSRGRKLPRDPTPTDEERVALHRMMFAYAGTYSLEAGKVTHHVDISWNEAWNGTDQVRSYEIKENTLTLTSSAIDPTSGTAARYVVVWEKVTSSRRRAFSTPIRAVPLVDLHRPSRHAHAESNAPFPRLVDGTSATSVVQGVAGRQVKPVTGLTLREAPGAVAPRRESR